METLHYKIGLDDRPINAEQLSLIVSLLSSPTSLTERYQHATKALFHDPSNCDELFYILGRSSIFTYLDELDSFDRRQKQLLHDFQRSLFMGFQSSITAFHLIRAIPKNYEKPVRVTVPPHASEVSFKESFTVSSMPYEVITQVSRQSLADLQEDGTVPEAQRVGLIKGAHIAAYLLQMRHHQLVYEFETSDLDAELESISSRDPARTNPPLLI